MGKRGLSTSGAVLRAARVLAGMTQRELATAASLHPKSIAYWERKGSRGRYGEVGVRRIVEALRAHGVEIFGNEGEGVRRVRNAAHLAVDCELSGANRFPNPRR